MRQRRPASVVGCFVLCRARACAWPPAGENVADVNTVVCSERMLCNSAKSNLEEVMILYLARKRLARTACVGLSFPATSLRNGRLERHEASRHPMFQAELRPWNATSQAGPHVTLKSQLVCRHRIALVRWEDLAVCGGCE